MFIKAIVFFVPFLFLFASCSNATTSDNQNLEIKKEEEETKVVAVDNKNLVDTFPTISLKQYEGQYSFDLMENKNFVSLLKDICGDDYGHITTNFGGQEENQIVKDDNGKEYLVVSDYMTHEDVVYESVIVASLDAKEIFAATTDKNGKAAYVHSNTSAYPNVFQKWIDDRK